MDGLEVDVSMPAKSLWGGGCNCGGMASIMQLGMGARFFTIIS